MLFIFNAILFLIVIHPSNTSSNNTNSVNTDAPTIQDVASCTCDLTAGSCDVNCCCDKECSSEDKAVFSTCIETAEYTAIKYCISDFSIFQDNSEFSAVNLANNLLCLFKDNYEERNKYYDVSPVSSASEFEYLIQQQTSASPETPGTEAVSFPAKYLYDAPIYTFIENGAISPMTLPSTGFSSSECNFYNTIGYYKQSSSSCYEIVSTSPAESDCTTTSFSLESYVNSFKVIKETSFVESLRSTTNISNTTQLAEIFENNTSLLSIVVEKVQIKDPTTGFISTVEGVNFSVTDYLTPTFNASTSVCQNALIDLTYQIDTVSGSVISRIVALPTLSNIDFTQLASQQNRVWHSFAVTFTSNANTKITERSGNPGYLIGKGLIKSTISTDNVLSFNSLDPYLTVLKSSADGSCSIDPSSRQPITFGENMQTSCFVEITSSLSNQCAAIQNQTLLALEGVVDVTKYYVAKFGNYDEAKSNGDWVQVTTKDRILSENMVDGLSCNPIINGLTINILYANVGRITNPQPKIVGVQYDYSSGRLSFNCGAFNCIQSATLKQRIPITTFVTFVDVSNPVEDSIKYPSKIRINLPLDFFAPFYSHSTLASCSIPLFFVLVIYNFLIC